MQKRRGWCEGLNSGSQLTKKKNGKKKKKKTNRKEDIQKITPHIKGGEGAKGRKKRKGRLRLGI